MRYKALRKQTPKSNVIQFPCRDLDDPSPYIDADGQLDILSWLSGDSHRQVVYSPADREATIFDLDGKAVWTIRRAA